MTKKDVFEVFSNLLDCVPDDVINLPAWGNVSAEESQFAEKALAGVEAYIGPSAELDYYKTSRARFATMIILARRHLPLGSKILDVGNAPGFLAMALQICGFKVCGLNLSDEWVKMYPVPEMVDLFSVKACDIERERLPFDAETFDAILFTEVLEHIAIKHPKSILPEFRRVLKKKGLVLFSTPNVCNLSNVIALITGKNVFWPSDIFFGSTDRHNREFTPSEVMELFTDNGFGVRDFFGTNDHANWRTGTQDLIYPFMATNPPGHALLRNTIVGVFQV